jgi:hypothetical protein
MPYAVSWYRLPATSPMPGCWVGRQFRISEVTVKTHINHIFQKLGIRDRVGLALYAVRTGIMAVHQLGL